MATKVKRIVLWRGEIDNVPGALARTLGPLAKSNLEVLMGYHRHGDGNRALIEAYPITGKQRAAARSVGLTPATLPALQVEGDDRSGLGHAIAQSLGDAGININFLVAQALKKKFAAVLGFESDEAAKRAATLIKKAAAPKKATKRR
jgi:predicted amino acid-binding ACT domain protein